MLASLLRSVRGILQAFIAHDAPNQLAAGFALGMVLGLVPKGNLIAVSLLVLLFSLRVNRGLGIVAALAFSWIGPALDPFADKLGAYALSTSPMQTTYATLFNLPLGPWFEFDDTVVVGSLLLGLYAFYPVYWFSYISLGGFHASRDDAATFERQLADDRAGRRAA